MKSNENNGKQIKINEKERTNYENTLKLMKIFEKIMKTNENKWKQMKTNGNRLKFTKSTKV